MHNVNLSSNDAYNVHMMNNVGFVLVKGADCFPIEIKDEFFYVKETYGGKFYSSF